MRKLIFFVYDPRRADTKQWVSLEPAHDHRFRYCCRRCGPPLPPPAAADDSSSPPKPAAVAAAAAAVPTINPAPYVTPRSFCIKPGELVYAIYYRPNSSSNSNSLRECLALYNRSSKKAIHVAQGTSLLNLLHCPTLRNHVLFY